MKKITKTAARNLGFEACFKKVNIRSIKQILCQKIKRDERQNQGVAGNESGRKHPVRYQKMNESYQERIKGHRVYG